MQGQGRSPACHVAVGTALSHRAGCVCGGEKEAETSHEDWGGEESVVEAWKSSPPSSVRLLLPLSSKM